MQELITFKSDQLSKANADLIRKEISDKVVNGEIDPIQVAASIKFYEKIFEGDSGKNNGVNHIIRPYVVDELEKDKLRTKYYGFEVAVKESGSRYDFSNCNHPKLEELYAQAEEIKNKIAEIEKFLKGIQPGGSMTIVDEDSGEAIKIYAPVKKSTTSPVFTLK